MEGIVNYYLDSVMAPMKTLSFKEGVLLVEETKAPKTIGTVEEWLDMIWNRRFLGITLLLNVALMLITS